jgi:hypothetical protein
MVMTPNSSAQRRAFFRLRYPPTEGPLAGIGSQKYEVSELSEGGARILLPGDWTAAIGRPIEGTLEFIDGDAIPVEGVVLRIEGPEVIIQFTKGVSFRRMLAEHSRILRAYPFIHKPTSGSGPG